MNKKLLHFRGIYGEHQEPFWDADVHLESIKLTSESYNFEIDEHVHSNLIQIFQLEEGEGTCYSEGTAYNLQTPCMIIVPSGNLHGFDWHPNIKGAVWTITTSLFEKSQESNQQILLHFQEMRYFKITESQMSELTSIKDQMTQELSLYETEKATMIKILLQLFMTKLYRYDQDQNTQTVQNNNKALSYLNKFQKVINQQMDRSITINSYAQQLGITPIHLNRICQNTVGKTALQLVNEKHVNQAKKYLLGTTNTISEISYLLNFKDPSHFSKFFKRMSGKGPREFRKHDKRKIPAVST